jgi:hypothetical protein
MVGQLLVVRGLDGRCMVLRVGVGGDDQLHKPGNNLCSNRFLNADASLPYVSLVRHCS